MVTCPARFIASAAIAVGLTAALSAGAQDFRLPVDCSRTVCAVQNYADLDPTSGNADPACGRRTYDGHEGLDIRVTGAAARTGVEVLAPSAGIVRSIRDGEKDGAYLAGSRSTVSGRECGNGMVIDHAGGWSSQLCHLRRASVRVRVGETVVAGQALGFVGLSGFSQYWHVHLTLRKDKALIEPSSGRPLAGASCRADNLSAGLLWSQPARAALQYRDTQWLELGFAGMEPNQDPSLAPADAGRNAPTLVFWALAIGPRAGDILRVKIFRPDGALLAEGERTQPRDQAQAWLFAGRRTPPGGWPAGLYRGEALLTRGERIIESRQAELRLAP